MLTIEGGNRAVYGVMSIRVPGRRRLLWPMVVTFTVCNGLSNTNVSAGRQSLTISIVFWIPHHNRQRSGKRLTSAAFLQQCRTKSAFALFCDWNLTCFRLFSSIFPCRCLVSRFRSSLLVVETHLDETSRAANSLQNIRGGRTMHFWHLTRRATIF